MPGETRFGRLDRPRRRITPAKSSAGPTTSWETVLQQDPSRRPLDLPIALSSLMKLGPRKVGFEELGVAIQSWTVYGRAVDERFATTQTQIPSGAMAALVGATPEAHACPMSVRRLR